MHQSENIKIKLEFKFINGRQNICELSAEQSFSFAQNDPSRKNLQRVAIIFVMSNKYLFSAVLARVCGRVFI